MVHFHDRQLGVLHHYHKQTKKQKKPTPLFSPPSCVVQHEMPNSLLCSFLLFRDMCVCAMKLKKNNHVCVFADWQ